MGLLKNKILGIDARKKERAPICVLVEQPGQAQEYFDKSIDVSENGIFVETESPKAKGTEVTVRFALPGSPVITANGRVARVKKKSLLAPSTTAGMGIEFLELDEQTRSVLRKFTGPI